MTQGYFPQLRQIRRAGAVNFKVKLARSQTQHVGVAQITDSADISRVGKLSLDALSVFTVKQETRPWN